MVGRLRTGLCGIARGRVRRRSQDSDARIMRLLSGYRLASIGVLCVLTALLVGCAARGPSSFPGALSRVALPQPAPRLTQSAAEPQAPASSRPVPGPAFDRPQGPVPLDANHADDAERVDFEQIYEPPVPAFVVEAAPDAGQLSYDIDIPMNDRVQAFIRLLSGRLKSFLEEGLSRGVQFLPMVQEVFRAEGLPLDLAYVPLIESAFKPTALSRAKARGIWQFMRGTGLENGLTHDWYIDERADPEKATHAAAKYLKTLSATFDGDWHLALASYNGGPGRVQRAVRRSGHNDFWLVSASSRYLPRETRDYVPLVLAAITIARNPAEYGLTIQPFEPQRSETVALPAALDLRRLSGWIGTPIESIRALNPELRQWTTPLRASAYELKVPVGTGDILRAHLEQTAPADLTTINWHTVKKGDTLASVAKTLKVTRAELAEANYLTTRVRLQAGQRLIIPRAPVLPTGVQFIGDVAENTPSAAAVTVVASKLPTPDRSPTPRVHRVRRGDTLFSIARLYRTTVASIKGWNRLRTDSIQVGQRLTIFNIRPATATN